MINSISSCDLKAPSAPREKNSALFLSIAFFVSAFILTRHSQLPESSVLVAPLTLAILFATVRIDRTSLTLAPMAIYCCVSLMVSSMVGNELSVSLRFLVITMATLLAFNVRTRPVSTALALLPVILQAFGIAALSFFLTISNDPHLASIIRGAAHVGGWGDIYSFDGVYFRVQLVGNALIPFLFMVSLWHSPSKFKRWGLFTSTLGLVAAGNLTYFITAALALIIRFRSHLLSQMRTLLAVALILTIATLSFYDAASETISRKFSGDESSMGIRFDQIEAVVKATSQTPAALLSGAGLGSRFPNGRIIDYSDSLYIELQALYVGYQIGLFGVAIYIGSLVFLARQRLSSKGRTLFYLYMLSGISNPYILDTNQIFVTMLLVHLFPKVVPRKNI
jgi:hypothetical protein